MDESTLTATENEQRDTATTASHSVATNRLFSRFVNDPVFRKLIRNTSTVLTGNVGGSALSFVATAITARALGPEQFGVLVSIRAYSNVMKDFADSRCVLPLIKYAAETDSEAGFLKLVKLGTVIDACTSLLGGTAALLGAHFAARWLHWNQSTTHLAMLYSIVLFCNMTNTPTMILRIADKYRTFAVVSIVATLITVAASVAGWMTHAGLRTFILIWLGTESLVSLLLLFFAWLWLGRQRLATAAKIPLRETWRAFSGFWSFLASVNVTATVRMATSELDTLLVAGAIGTVGAGFYKVIKQAALIPAKLVDPLSQVVYPGLASAWAKLDMARFRSFLALAVAFGAGCAAAVFLTMLFFGNTAIRFSFGSDFLPALSPMRWYLAGSVIGGAAFSLDRSLLVMGKASLSLLLVTIATIVYFVAFFPLVRRGQLVGVSLDYLLFQTVWSTLILVSVIRRLRNRRSDTPAGMP